MTDRCRIAILGGGIHGITAALRLLHDGICGPEHLRILDTHGTPLARWERVTANTGMRELRSPGLYHVAPDPEDLFHFAQSPAAAPVRELRGDFYFPGLALFSAHARHRVAQAGLRASWRQGIVTSLFPARQGWRLEALGGTVEAECVILAPGMGGHEAWPAWALSLRRLGAPIAHLLDPHFEAARLARGPLAIVGGGLTAATFATVRAQEFGDPVHLICRSEPTVHLFDSDPGWLGPRHLAGYWRIPDAATRLRVVREARHRGSVTPEVAAEVKRLRAAGAIVLEQDVVVEASYNAGEQWRLRLSRGHTLGPFSFVLLGTGYDFRFSRLSWLAQALERARLPTACDRPLVGPNLEWAPGLFVTGALAEVEVGPVARNIAGARMAAERISRALQGLPAPELAPQAA
ncbi:MAG TPA: FAD/NAD(P)-binding protein [Candidatus Methylomirabilis sp.]|jgi:cation diffusion facilitator CzcD-associated flavoprotein CzcO